MDLKGKKTQHLGQIHIYRCILQDLFRQISHDNSKQFLAPSICVLRARILENLLKIH
jgi:hypothetical protein